MAALQLRNDSWRILFRYGGKQHTFTLGEVAESEAQAVLGKTRYWLTRLKNHLADLPPDCDIVTFIQHDGKPPSGPVPPPPRETTFGELRDAYLKTFGNGALEQNTLYTAAIHLGHLAGTLGEQFVMNALAAADLQRHIDRRSREGPRPKTRKGTRKPKGNPVPPVQRKPLAAKTLKMEIETLRSAWNWALRMGMVKGDCPTGGLVYPKADEKLPFMTWAEIERRVAANGGNGGEGPWECLYLTTAEIEEFLTFAKGRAVSDWVYPALLFVAHTGARKSEMLRARCEDVDLTSGFVTIREKKRVRGKRTTRRVPMSTLLSALLRDWLGSRQGKAFLFGPGDRQLSPQAGQQGFERAVRGSKWEVLKGWHVLRHSFISALASRGVDQRLVDDFVGHQTEEQRRRYRHLYPSTQQEAIKLVFG